MNQEDKLRQGRLRIAQQLARVRGERVLKEVRELPRLVEEFARRRSTPPKGQATAKR